MEFSMVIKTSKKLFTFILVIILMSSLLSFNVSTLSMGVTIAETDPVATVQSLISTAIANGATTVTVTGSKITANSILTLNIPAGVTVVWNAVYKGTANPVIDYYGAGTLEIGASGSDIGWVQNTSTPNSFTAIRANGNSLVVGNGGTVQSGKGRAIEGAGPNTVVSVTGGTVLNEATSNLFPVIDMTNASNVSSVNVAVSDGEVFAATTAAGSYGYVIQSYGNVAISGGTLSTSGVYGRVVNLVGDSSNVTVSGGVLQATGSGGTAISTSTTAPTQVINTSVNITGGFVASYATGGTGWAIHTTGSNSTVSISGGTVFAYGNSITGATNSVIYTERNAGGFSGTTTNDGVVIAWDRPAWVAGGQGIYFTGYTTDIRTAPAAAAGVTANWQKGSPKPDGIRYSYSGNTGFIQLPEVTVVDEYYTVSITFGPGLDPGCFVSSGSFPTITNYQPISVRYNDSLSFTVTPSATNYILAIDTWYPPAGSQYYSTLLFTGGATGVPFTYTIQNVVSNQVIRVFFARPGPLPQYSIVAFAGIGGSFSPSGSGTAPPNSNRTYTVTAQTGYYISGVVVDGTSVIDDLADTVNWPGTTNLHSGTYTFINIVSNHVITATFERINLNITATAGAGGSISPQGNVAVPYGSNQTFTITPDEGYFIEELLIGDGAGNVVSVPTTSEYVFTNVTDNHTISVTFALNTYAFNVSSGVGGTVSGTPGGYYAAGDFINVMAEPDSGYHFTGWTISGADIIGGDFAKPATFNMPANAVTLTATFAPNPPDEYTLNVIGGVGGTVSGTISGAYVEGYFVSVVAEADSGYNFTGWTITGADIIGGEFAKPATFNMPANAVTLTANFELNPPNEYTLNIIGGVGGTVSGTQSGAYIEGYFVSVVAEADAGYYFTGWTITGAQIIGGEYAKPATFNMPANAVTLTATFALNPPATYTLNVIGAAGGIVSGTQSGAYVEGYFVSVVAEADSGYHFTGWTITGAEILGGEFAKPAAFNMPANAVTLTANFEQNPPETYTLNVIGAVGGTISGTQSGFYVEGFFVSVTATANSGYHFTGWTIAGAQIAGGEFAKPATFNMPANAVTLSANFSPNPPETFTLNVIGGAGGTISGTRSGAYAQGFAVQVTASANSGYRFVGWTITGATITGGNNVNPAQFLMPGNAVTLTAVFDEIREAGSPQTGINRNIMLPIVMLITGAVFITGAELYRKGLFKRTKQK
jgi:uncharacterized repeat protein (TIGR02543 family)